jgi:hypothetical protein
LVSRAHASAHRPFLEDLAGNRIGRAFEVDFERTDVTSEPERSTVPLNISTR